MRMNHVFLGYDHRQPISHTVLEMSIRATASRPVAVTPLCINQLPITRQGLTPFTYSRFLVPYLMGYKGWAVFLDTDQMLRADINDLFDMRDDSKAVMVVKNEKRFEWASVMLMNCARLDFMTPEYVETTDDKLHGFSMLAEDAIGELPPEWNYLVGYDAPMSNPRLVHFTQGVPAFPETQGSEFEEEWQGYVRMATSAMDWQTLMGRSVHVARVGDRLMPKWKAEQMRNES